MRVYLFFFAILALLISMPATAKQTQSVKSFVAADINDDLSKAGRGIDPDDIEYEEVTVVDEEETGMDAFTILVPDGWEFVASLSWQEIEGMPYFYPVFAIYTEDMLYVLGYNQGAEFIWFDDRDMQDEYEGSEYVDNLEVREPIDLDEQIEDTLDALAGPDYEILESDEEPEIGEWFLTLLDPLEELDEDLVQSGYVWIDENGAESIICTAIYIADPVTIDDPDFGEVEATIWSACGAICESAPSDDIEDMLDVYEEIMDSFEWNDEFLDEYADMLEDAGY